MTTAMPQRDLDIVDAILRESDLDGDESLRSALLELRGLAADAPLAAPISIRDAPSRRTRVTIAALATVVGLGLGVGSAAAVVPPFAEAARDAIVELVETVIPATDPPADPSSTTKETGREHTTDANTPEIPARNDGNAGIPARNDGNAGGNSGQNGEGRTGVGLDNKPAAPAKEPRTPGPAPQSSAAPVTPGQPPATPGRAPVTSGKPGR